MPRMLTDDELADVLGGFVVKGDEAPFLAEAIRRLRNQDFKHLVTVNRMVESVNSDPRVDDKTSKVVEELITSVPISAKGPSSVVSMAEKILRGYPYDDAAVREIAALLYALTTDKPRAEVPLP